MANLTPEWLKTALEVTGSIETNGNPWAGVAHDFDGQGISCGILQWNIGQGSLQPLVKACGQVTVQNYMPTYGGQLWTACHQSISNGLATVRSWQPTGNLRPDVRNELRALFGSPEMIEQQMSAATGVGERSLELASRWAEELRGGDPVLKEFCFFFDVVTQNGGMKGVWLDGVHSFITDRGRANVSNAICDWILNRPSHGVDHLPDGRKNAALWRNNVADADLELFTVAYLRSLKSVHQYQVVVLNRKGTIALTRGWVNSGLVDLPQLRNNAPTPHGETPVSKFVVSNTASLNLRSAPDPSDAANIIAALPANHEVIKLANTNVANWWRVRTIAGGISREGYVNRKYLAPADSQAAHEVVVTN